MQNKRVMVYVDGENFSIFLQKYLNEEKDERVPNIHWINLAKSFLRPQENEVLENVKYFSVRYKYGTEY